MPYCTDQTGSYQVNSCSECAGMCNPGPPGGPPYGPSFCFISTIMTQSLGQLILNLGKTYQTQIDFRDKVLNSSSIGRRFVKLYYRHNPAMIPYAMANPSLLGQAIHTWFVIAPFVREVVAASGHGAPAKNKQIRFNALMHKRVIEMLKALRAEVGNKGLQNMLDEVQAELRRYVGLNPHEALEMIRRNVRRSAKGIKRPGR